MRIAILSRYQNSSARGVESFVTELTQRLSKAHQIEVLSGPDSDSLGKVLKGKFDVVMPMNGRGQSLKMSFGRSIGGYKLVIGGHAGIGRDDLWNIAICRPNLFVALTEHQAAWAKKFALGVKVEVISNGVDITKFNPAGQKFFLDMPRPLILTVGALEWYKRHELTIDAVSRLNMGSLIIVGSGTLKGKLELEATQKLDRRFKILNVDYSQMPAVYRACDLFVLPSWDREAFGLVYLEAMASGLGVVAPNDPSRQEIVGSGGVLVNVENPADYAQAISNALNENWRDRALAQAEKFSWEKIALQYEYALLGLLKK